MTVTEVRQGIHCIDLQFQGRPGVIAAYLIQSQGERALVEVGPTSTLETLLEGLSAIEIPPESIGKVLVTHIHLDHAGAAGTFLRRFPQADLFVHEVGAPHMIDPSRLLASAVRIYGDRMGPLWGDFEAVPADRVRVVRDGDTIVVGDRPIRALYTPGHASHHVAFLDETARTVFTGDVAAVRLQGVSYVRPPTPPPDVDLDAWTRSLGRLEETHPRTLCLTHFGPFDDVRRHLKEAHDRLFAWAAMVEQALERGDDRDSIIQLIIRRGNAEILHATDDPTALDRYEHGAGYVMSVDGLLRYFRRRANTGGADR